MVPVAALGSTLLLLWALLRVVPGVQAAKTEPLLHHCVPPLFYGGCDKRFAALGLMGSRTDWALVGGGGGEALGWSTRRLC